MDTNAAQIEVGDEEERALLFRVTRLTPEPQDLSEDERKVLSVVRWWLLTGQAEVDAYALAEPWPENRMETWRRIRDRIRIGMLAIVDGPDIEEARVARRFLRRNREPLWRGGLEATSSPEPS
jgi:hypothetical protein